MFGLSDVILQSFAKFVELYVLHAEVAFAAIASEQKAAIHSSVYWG